MREGISINHNCRKLLRFSQSIITPLNDILSSLSYLCSYHSIYLPSFYHKIFNLLQKKINPYAFLINFESFNYSINLLEIFLWRLNQSKIIIIISLSISLNAGIPKYGKLRQLTNLPCKFQLRQSSSLAERTKKNNRSIPSLKNKLIHR